MDEKRRKHLTRQVALMEAAFILGTGACITLTAIVAMLIFGG